jgi:hypothetical protein
VLGVEVVSITCIKECFDSARASCSDGINVLSQTPPDLMLLTRVTEEAALDVVVSLYTPGSGARVGE